MAQGGSWDPAYGMCCRHQTNKCPKNKNGGGNARYRDQYSSNAPLEIVAPRGATIGTSGGGNHLYAMALSLLCNGFKPFMHQ